MTYRQYSHFSIVRTVWGQQKHYALSKITCYQELKKKTWFPKFDPFLVLLGHRYAISCFDCVYSGPAESGCTIEQSCYRKITVMLTLSKVEGWQSGQLWTGEFEMRNEAVHIMMTWNELISVRSECRCRFKWIWFRLITYSLKQVFASMLHRSERSRLIIDLSVPILLKTKCCTDVHAFQHHKSQHAGHVQTLPFDGYVELSTGCCGVC